MKLRELLSGVEVLEWHAPEEFRMGTLVDMNEGKNQRD